MQHFQSGGERQRFDCRGLQTFAAARGPVGLSQYGANVVPRRNEGFKVLCGELGCAGKKNPLRGFHLLTALAMRFFKLAPDALALEWRQVINEQFSLKVINFMLKANGQQAIEGL